MRQSLYILTLCLLAGCQWADYDVDPQMKTDYSFQVGTYWVYQDSITGAMDSFVILHTINFIEHIGVAREHVAIEVDSVFNNGMLDTVAFTYILRKNIIEIRAGKESFKYWGVYLEYPIKDTIKTSSTVYNTATTQLGTYTIDGNTYNNVTMIYRTDKDTTFTDRIYLAPGIGLIKVDLNHSGEVHNWRLLRHKIVH